MPACPASKSIVISLLERKDFILAAQAMTKYWIIPNTSKILSITKQAANMYDRLYKAQCEGTAKCFAYKTKKKEAFSFQASVHVLMIHHCRWHYTLKGVPFFK